MARDPGSLWTPLPEAGVPDGLMKNKFIVHSTGSNASAAAIDRYFRRGDVQVESTFIVGWGPEDPTRQIMDSTDRADANVAANDEGISVEVVGDGRTGFNAWQTAELIRLGRWARSAHPAIAGRVLGSPAQHEGGLGWHVMFGAPGPWTTVVKVCPGGPRIAELKSLIFPAIIGAPMPAPTRARPGALPRWSLPRGHYYGNVAGPNESHGGFHLAERPVVKLIQQWLIYRGCVRGVAPSAWPHSTWADGIWGDPTDDACMRWFARYRPGQPFTSRIYADDYVLLDD